MSGGRTESASRTLRDLVHEASVLVSVGSGGVGKTTTAALLGLEAALAGRRVLVMTVDPARRLANSLGLDEMKDEVQQIDLAHLDPAPGGELHATMLDMKEAFDAIVTRHAKDEATRDAILGNRFYRFFSTSLAGAQELSASERLYEVVASGEWDLVVLDTPPTANALDFLEAPLRFFDALDSAAFQWAIQAGQLAARGGVGLLHFGTHLVTRTLGRFTGEEFFAELSSFLGHFSSLFDGFRERTRATSELLTSPTTRFVIVTSPDPLTVEEALYFRERLAEHRVHLAAVVVNRVRPFLQRNALVRDEPTALVDALHAIEGAAMIGRPLLERLARAIVRNAREIDVLAARDRGVVADLVERTAPAPVCTAPLYAHDVHTLDGLDRMRKDLFDADPTPATPKAARG